MEPRELLTANYMLVQRAVAFTCRRLGFAADDAEEIASIVNLHFVEKDYAALRAWEGRSSLKTYIAAIVHRLALDYRIHAWGKWHASAEAKRLGFLALNLEQLLYRDHRAIEEAFVILAAKYKDVTLGALLALASRFPQRAPRRRNVDIEEAASVKATQDANPEEHALDEERRALAQRVSSVMAETILTLPDRDLLVVKLRFVDGMTAPQIARALKLEQRDVYQRIERCKRELRRALEGAGISARDVSDLTGHIETLIRFSFVKQNPRPSELDDETEAADSEDPQ